MNVIDTEIPEVKILEPAVFKDNRGYFFESFNISEFSEKVKSNVSFVQDNESCSCYGTLRGLHWQKPPYAQSKLVRVVKGKVMDVAVDIRKGSPTFGKYASAILSEENHRQLFIPRGFAHGFVALTNEVIFQYKCDNLYNKASESGLAWDCVGIDWPIESENIILSDKDKNRWTLENIPESELFDYEKTL